MPSLRLGLLAGAVLLAAVSDLEAAARIVLNEVHYHPGDDIREGEFIELHNYGAEAADLGGWFLTGGVEFTFPRPTVIEGGAFLVVAADPGVLESRYGLESSIVTGPYTGSLSNGGERVELWTSGSYLMSFIAYGDSDPWPEEADGLGCSLERISPLREEDDALAWAASIPVGGTPGAPNSVRVEDPLPPEASRVFVPFGATWSYFKGTEEPPPDWMETAFDDGSWDAGPAGFGYDDGDDATVLSDMQNGYSTLYIRNEFQVADAGAVESLLLSVWYDDGYVAYLNGQEVDRENVPGSAGTPLPHDSGSLSTVNAAPLRQVDLTSVRDLLVEGSNVLALQGVNNAIDNPDFTLHPKLEGSVAQGALRSVDYIRPGETWRLFRGTREPPVDWAGLNFVDGEWEEGPSGFGYGDGDDATVLEDMEDSYLTVFVRRGFQVVDASKVTSLTLTVDYDDGFIAYLNGVEVRRANVSTPGYSIPADSSHEAGDAELFSIGNLDGLLQTGFNVLAIEAHNSSLTSSDLSLIPSLTGLIFPEDAPPEPDPPPRRPPREIVINELATGGPGDGWVELFNTASQEVSLEGMRLELCPPGSGRYVFLPGASLESGGFLVVSEPELGFSLAGINALILSNEDDHYLDALNPRTTLPTHSTGRWPDGDDNRFVCVTPTPGGSNLVELDDRIVINEIQFHPADANTGGEFIELYNRSVESVDLTGWSFTRGIEYTFVDPVEIAPGDYLVLARDPAAAAAYYGIPLPHGPYSGRLRNDAETLLLRDRLSNPVDRVRYADEGSWPDPEEGPSPDGGGPSVELIHPDLENRYGPAWAASDGEGSPGALNTAWTADPGPVVVDVGHKPVIPTPEDSVRVTARVSDEQGITSVTLLWRDDGSGSTDSAPMFDDGIVDDGIVANGVYGAEIPPRSDGTIVQFWIEAAAVGGQTVTVPTDAPRPSFLYQVETPGAEQVRPVYRIIMQSEDLDELRSRSRDSNVPLDCTFVAAGRSYYNRGLHYRGRSSRRCDPLSYRVHFDHDVDLHGFQRLNINGCNTQRQWIGLDFLSRTGVATPQSWFRKLSINGDVDPGLHLRVEAIDEQFLERLFPGDDGGNLYRGEQQANLDYRGEDFDNYTLHYEKESNEEQADWSDVVELCFLFDDGTTSDEDFDALVEDYVDVYQWALYFAAFAVLGSTEGSIVLDRGDDYFLYHRPSDGRWLLLPWDLDSCFDQENQVLFRPTVDQIERFLENPRYAPIYWCYLASLLEGAFVTDIVDSRIDHLVSLFNSSRVQDLRQFAPARYAYISSRITPRLTVDVAGGGRLCGNTLVVAGSPVALEGFGPGCGTTEVLVDGESFPYDPRSNEWSGLLDVSGSGEITIEARDKDGLLVERIRLTALLSTSSHVLSGSITGSRTLTASESPYRVAGTATVEAGSTLQVEAGVTVVFDTDAALIVEGRLLVDGVEGEEVVFTTDECSAGGEGLLFRSGSSGSRVSHALFSGLRQAPQFASAVAVDGPTLSWDHVTFLGDGSGVLVEVAGGGDLTLEDSRLGSATTGLLVTGGSVSVRGSTLEDFMGDALRCEGETTASLETTLFLESDTAVTVTDGASAALEHLTVYACDNGVDVAERTPGEGSGAVTAHSLIIWESVLPVVEDAGSLASLTFSDLNGVGVWPGQGNINAAPLFLDEAARDFGLSWFSPCRATGKDGTDMGAFPYVPGETGSFRRCDTNGDGENDLSDGVFTLLHLFGGGAPPVCEPSADCNGDGDVDVSDVIFYLNFLFLAGESPPAPYPSCEVVPIEVCPGNFCP